MDLDIAVIDGAELDAGDNGYAVQCARGGGGGYTRDRIVVGDGNGGEAERGGLRQ